MLTAAFEPVNEGVSKFKNYLLEVIIQKRTAKDVERNQNNRNKQTK